MTIDTSQLQARMGGPLVPVMPAFDDDEALDLDATCRLVSSLIDRGIRAFWTTYGTSHFFSLSDREIEELTLAVAAVTKGRAVFIASTSYHWPVPQVLAFCERVGRAGVDVVKVQVDWRLAPSEAAVLEHYRRIAARTPLPLFAYALGAGTFGASNAISGPSLTLFASLLELPAMIGMKNDTGDFYEQTAYLRAVRESGRTFDVVTGGSMESFLHGSRFGQRMYAAGLGLIAPEVALPFDEDVTGGRDEAALTTVRDIEQPLWAALAGVGFWPGLHEALRIQGHYGSRVVRFPQRTIDDEQRAGSQWLWSRSSAGREPARPNERSAWIPDEFTSTVCDQNRLVAVSRSAVPELTMVVATPAENAATIRYCAGMVVTRCDRRDAAGEAGHVDGAAADACRRAVPELAVAVRAPALHAAPAR